MSKTKEEIREIFKEVQAKLKELYQEDASFLFIGVNDGGFFSVSGDVEDLQAELALSMVRYPVIHKIISTVTEKYEIINEEYGDKIRNMKMETETNIVRN